MFRDYRERQALRAKLAMLAPLRPADRIDCRMLAAARPLVVLALGQSNAANHGSPVEPTVPPVAVLAGDGCMLTRAPLPGATGNGGSVWQPMAQALRQMAPAQLIVVSVLGVDATTIRDWTRPDSPLALQLREQVKANIHLGFAPDLILWQQGEADARAGTTAVDYAAGLRALAETLAATGTSAPIMLAQSTVCRSTPSVAVRQAIRQMLAEDGRFIEGPDTDQLAGNTSRRDGCHFNASGLAMAGDAWARSIHRWQQTVRRPP